MATLNTPIHSLVNSNLNTCRLVYYAKCIRYNTQMQSTYMYLYIVKLKFRNLGGNSLANQCKSSLWAYGKHSWTFDRTLKSETQIIWLLDRNTVASIKIIYKSLKTFPFINMNLSIRVFRHALSLDKVCPSRHSPTHIQC